MIQQDGQNGSGSAATMQEPAASAAVIGTNAAGDALGHAPELATRAKQRTRQQFLQNRFVIIGAGAIVVALLIFVATSIPGKRPVPKSKNGATATTQDVASESSATPSDKSCFLSPTPAVPPQKRRTKDF